MSIELINGDVLVVTYDAELPVARKEHIEKTLQDIIAGKLGALVTVIVMDGGPTIQHITKPSNPRGRHLEAKSETPTENAVRTIQEMNERKGHETVLKTDLDGWGLRWGIEEKPKT